MMNRPESKTIKTKPHVLFVTEKWCDCNPNHGPTNSEHNFFGSLEATGLATQSRFHFDEYYFRFKRRGDEALLTLCMESNPDVIFFTWAPAGLHNPTRSTFYKIRHEMGIPIIVMWSDFVWAHFADLAKSLSPFIDLNVIRDSEATLEKVTDREKYLLMWTPQDPRIFYNPGLERDIRISFLGSIQDFPDRLSGIAKLKACGMDVYQTGGQREHRMSIEDYAQVYQRSTIVLNFNRTPGGTHLHLKGRVFEATLCGAMLLDSENPETPKWFEPMVEYVPFRGENDLVDKTRYYLAHDAERIEIAERGYRRAKERYSAEAFWKIFLDKAAGLTKAIKAQATLPEMILMDPSPGDIPKDQYLIPKLFEAGNYTTVAATGSPNQWQTHAALGLIGKTKEAIEGLSHFDQTEAYFFLAVAYWIGGDDTSAIHLLREIHTPHARNLLALIEKPNIHVLAQLPWTREAPHDLLTASNEDNKFRVKNISFDLRDLQNEPYADIHKFYNPERPPDFYICQMVEWHLIPTNLQKLPCPILGVTADYDVHIQAVYPWLKVFDELIVAAQKEWKEVRNLSEVPVSTFPKLYGIFEKLSPLTPRTRTMDLFFSGTLMHPYHPEKARILHQLFTLPEIKIRCIEGFIAPYVYNMILGHTKIGIAYVRHPDGMVTRGLEALSMGCATLVQKGSALTLFAGEEEGVLTYDLERGDLSLLVRRILEEWPEFEKRARRGAEIVRREFALPKVASQYMRFLTFLASKPRGGRKIQSSEELDQKRRILWKGWLPGELPLLKKMRKKNFSRWQERLKVEKGPSIPIDMGRELILDHATAVLNAKNSMPDKHTLHHAFKLYRKAIREFPRSLVLRFNLIRASYHFGDPERVSKALELARETIGKDVSHWQVDPMEDIFPWDFFSAFFNYRRYFDLVTKHLMEKVSVEPDLIRLILASIHYYVGRYSQDANHLKAAVSLDPEFAYYRYDYARILVDQRTDDEEAGRLLTRLASDSILYVEAFELLRKLRDERRFVAATFEEIGQKVKKAVESMRMHHFQQPFVLKPAIELPQRIAPSQHSEATDNVAKAAGNKKLEKNEILVSALVPTYNSERFVRGLLEDLEAQTIADRLEIIIVDSNSPQKEGEIVKEFQKRYNNIVYLRTDEWENSHKATNRAIELAHGNYLTLACMDDRHKQDALERMVAVLDSRPDIGLVYANSYVTLYENELFENFTQVGTYRWIDFDPLKLLAGCFIGPQPMWRKNLHEKYGRFDEGLKSAGDWDLWLRFAEGETFLHIDEFLGLYLYSPTSSEHRDPELSRREAQVVQKRYLSWQPALMERKKMADLKSPASSGMLAFVIKDEKTEKEGLAQCIERLRGFSSRFGNLSVRVVRSHSGVAENELGVKFSPGTLTTMEALSRAIPWEVRYVLLLSSDIFIDPLVFEKMLEIAELDPLVVAVEPASNKGSILQRIEKEDDHNKNGLERFAKDRKIKCREICLLLKSNVLWQAGGVKSELSLEDGLRDLYIRLQMKGYDLAFNSGIYAHRIHIKSCKEGMAGQDDLTEGERLFGLGNIDGAKRVFELILSAEPKRVEALNNLGVIAFQQAEIDEAISYFTRVIEINPNHFESIENMGNCMAAKQDFKDAIQWFKRALELKPHDVSLLNSLANSFVQIEDFSGAEEVYSKSYWLDTSQSHIQIILQELERLAKVRSESFI